MFCKPQMCIRDSQQRPRRGFIQILTRELSAAAGHMGIPVHGPHYQPGRRNGPTDQPSLDHHRRVRAHRRSERPGSSRRAAHPRARRIVQILVVVPSQDRHGCDARHLSDGPVGRRPIRHRDRTLRAESSVHRKLISSKPLRGRLPRLVVNLVGDDYLRGLKLPELKLKEKKHARKQRRT